MKAGSGGPGSPRVDRAVSHGTSHGESDLHCHTRGMTEGAIQGELQEQIMIVLWHNGEGTVEHVRAGLPARHRSGYTTVQTVLNRLVDRGLLTRKRHGKTFVYTAKVTEGQYLSRSIERTLAGASVEARQAALAQLIGTIDTDELSALQERARQASAARKARKR